MYVEAVALFLFIASAAIAPSFILPVFHNQLESGDAAAQTRAKAKERCAQLAKVDPIRANYWNFRAAQIDNPPLRPVHQLTDLL